MIISISGTPGSGKTTIAKMLAEELNYKYYYIGGLRRDKAKKRGLTLEEYNQLGEKDFSTDLEVDEYQKELGKKEDNFVIQGRTSFYFIPHSLKIFLDVKPEEAAKRIYNDLKNRRGEARNLDSVSDVLKSNQERRKSDDLRYKKIYNLDVYNPRHYDLVLDTTNLNTEQVFKKVYDYLKKKIG
jgi:predicted cytidylate kinase